MQQPVLQTDKGFTIIEFMVSVLLLTVALFGLLTTLNLAMSTNMESKMRNDAAQLAEEYIGKANSVDYDNLATLNGGTTRDVLTGATTVKYTINTTVGSFGAADLNSSTVTVRVTWPLKGVTKEISITKSFTKPL